MMTSWCTVAGGSKGHAGSESKFPGPLKDLALKVNSSEMNRAVGQGNAQMSKRGRPGQMVVEWP